MTRDERQEEAAQTWLNTNRRHLINACPRFGKTRVAGIVVERLGAKKILVGYPRVEIKEGWEEAWSHFNLQDVDIEYITFKSIEKITGDYDLFIWDEPQEASLNQLKGIGKITRKVPTLALTGTLTRKTQEQIFDNTLVDVCYEYTIEQGVAEGILADYRITVHEVDLDNKNKIYKNSKGFLKTEKERFSSFEYVMENMEGNKFFMETKMIGLLQNSYTKKKLTERLLKNFSNERCLVFCGTTNIADSLGIPSYHSKTKEKGILEEFCNGQGIHLATIKMMSSGITIKPIQKGIMNYISGSTEDSTQKMCRFLGFEYDNPDKIADIHIISSTEKFEKMRMRTALLWFDPNKINYIKETL